VGQDLMHALYSRAFSVSGHSHDFARYLFVTRLLEHFHTVYLPHIATVSLTRSSSESSLSLDRRLGRVVLWCVCRGWVLFGRFSR
jgi:hypothetical protein